MILKVKELLETLYQYEVCYVLFGTLGAIAYGAQLSTRDMDICFATDEINRRHIAELLRRLSARPSHTPGWNTSEECDSWQPEPPTVENLDHEFITPYGKLDLVPRPFGVNGKTDRFDYDQLKKRATILQPFGIPIAVAHIDDLIASKISAQRSKDKVVYHELLRVRQLFEAGKELSGLERFPEGIRELKE